MASIIKQANTQQCYDIKKQQLPLSCPAEDMRVYDSHPRVFLPLGKQVGDEVIREVTCPYCGARYQLIDS